MLPRSHRLQRSSDIQQVMRQGKRLATPHVYIFLYKSPHQDTSRITAIVGKKVHASAVRRHRYQRWLRQLASQSLSHITQPYDMVWLARPSIKNVTTLNELRATVTPALEEVYGDIKE